MKKYKITGVITTAITLLPILIGLILWNRLPEQLPSHWGLSGEVDGWSSKVQAVFVMPCILAAAQIFVMVMIAIDPKKKHIHRKLMLASLWIIPMLSVVLNAATYMIALGRKINITVIIMILLGVLFIVFGNYMPKLQQNYTVGFRVPWTLNNEENWICTHRFGGKVFMAEGILLIIIGLLTNWIGETAAFIVLMVVVLGGAGITTGYSYWLFKVKHL